MFLKDVTLGEEYAIRVTNSDGSSTLRCGIARGFIRKRGLRTRVRVEWVDGDTGTPTGDTAYVDYLNIDHSWADEEKYAKKRAEKQARRQRVLRALERLRVMGYNVPNPYFSDSAELIRQDWYNILPTEDIVRTSFVALPVAMVEDLLVRCGAMAPDECDRSDPHRDLRAELAWLESVA